MREGGSPCAVLNPPIAETSLLASIFFIFHFYSSGAVRSAVQYSTCNALLPPSVYEYGACRLSKDDKPGSTRISCAQLMVSTKQHGFQVPSHLSVCGVLSALLLAPSVVRALLLMCEHYYEYEVSTLFRPPYIYLVGDLQRTALRIDRRVVGNWCVSCVVCCSRDGSDHRSRPASKGFKFSGRTAMQATKTLRHTYRCYESPQPMISDDSDGVPLRCRPIRASHVLPNITYSRSVDDITNGHDHLSCPRRRHKAKATNSLLVLPTVSTTTNYRTDHRAQFTC